MSPRVHIPWGGCLSPERHGALLAARHRVRLGDRSGHRHRAQVGRAQDQVGDHPVSPDEARSPSWPSASASRRRARSTRAASAGRAPTHPPPSMPATCYLCGGPPRLGPDRLRARFGPALPPAVVDPSTIRSPQSKAASCAATSRARRPSGNVWTNIDRATFERSPSRSASRSSCAFSRAAAGVQGDTWRSVRRRGDGRDAAPS